MYYYHVFPTGSQGLAPRHKFAPLKNIFLTVDLLPTEKKWATHALIHEVEWPWLWRKPSEGYFI